MKKLNVWTFVTTLAFAIFPGFLYGQTAGDYRSNGSGAWNDSSNWETYNGTDWVIGSHPNNSSGVITIMTGDTITVVTLGQTADQVVIDSGGVLIVSTGGLTIYEYSAVDLTVEGTLEGGPDITLSGNPVIRFKNNSKYEHKYSTTPGTILSAVWDSGSTCVIKGYTTNSSKPAGLNQLFHHFKWDCPNQEEPIDATSDTISVNGDFTVASTGSGSVAATVKMKGTSSQSFSVSGTLANTSNLIIDNATGVSLASSVAINNLEHVAGNLHLGNNNITIGGTVSGVAASKCIVTANGSTGKVVRAIAASESFTFPVAATEGAYNPVTLTLDASDPAETFHVRMVSGIDPPADDNQTLLQRTFDISENTTGGNNVRMSIQWNASEEGSSFSRFDAAFWHYNGSSWDKMTEGKLDSLGTGGPYTLTTVDTVSNFSRWSAGNSGGLPVELISFSATAQAFTAHLSWSTSTETDNAGWEVERRALSREYGVGSMEKDGWVKVGFVEGAGTSTAPREYAFSDQTPIPNPQSPSTSPSTSLGTRFAYRLKQIDRNGSYKYTAEAEVEVGIVPRVLTLDNNYPNPFNPATSLAFSLANDGYAALRVYDVLGQEIATLFEGPAAGGRAYQFTFDAADLPSGTYFARLESDGGRVMRKLVLMK